MRPAPKARAHFFLCGGGGGFTPGEMRVRLPEALTTALLSIDFLAALAAFVGCPGFADIADAAAFGATCRTEPADFFFALTP